MSELSMCSPQHFFKNERFDKSMGNDCFWSNISVLLNYNQKEMLALPYLDISCSYGGKAIDQKFLSSLERNKYQQGVVDNPFFKISSTALTINECFELIDKSSSPILVKVNLFPLSQVYSAFPKEDDYHYLVTFGFDNEKQNIYIVDKYFGFIGKMKSTLVKQSIEALNNPEVISLNFKEGTTYKDITSQLKYCFFLKLKKYLVGRYELIGGEFFQGFEAINRLVTNIDDVWCLLKKESTSIEQAFSKLSRRIDIFLSRERSGITTYLEMFNDSLNLTESEELIYLLAKSSHLMKRVSVVIVKGQLTNKEEAVILKKVKDVFEEILEVEKEIKQLIESIYYSNELGNI